MDFETIKEWAVAVTNAHADGYRKGYISALDDVIKMVGSDVSEPTDNYWISRITKMKAREEERRNGSVKMENV